MSGESKANDDVISSLAVFEECHFCVTRYKYGFEVRGKGFSVHFCQLVCVCLPISLYVCEACVLVCMWAGMCLGTYHCLPSGPCGGLHAQRIKYLFFIKKKRLLYFNFMHVCVYVCLYTIYTPGVCRGEERALHPLELES